MKKTSWMVILGLVWCNLSLANEVLLKCEAPVDFKNKIFVIVNEKKNQIIFDDLEIITDIKWGDIVVFESPYEYFIEQRSASYPGLVKINRMTGEMSASVDKKWGILFPTDYQCEVSKPKKLF